MQNRILVAGYDKVANHEFARALSEYSKTLIQSEHEFQMATELSDKYRWLNLFIEQENIYNQILIILWYNENIIEKKGKTSYPWFKKNLIQYSNEVLFQPYSNKKLAQNHTRVYYVNMMAKTRYQELTRSVLNSIETENVPGFSAGSEFYWDFPHDVMELYRM